MLNSDSSRTPNAESSRIPNSEGNKLPSWLIVVVILGILGFAWWQNNHVSQSTTFTAETGVALLPDEDLPTLSEVAPDVEGSEESASDLESDPSEQASEPVPTTTPSIADPEKRPISLRPSNSNLQVENQTIRDQNGRVVFKGTVDLKPTLDRIERGEENRHRNDGTTFQNRENHLPRKPAGYYKEYVHPTKGEYGPGPQRIIIGKEGEVWYTPDHYKSFRQIKRSK